MRTHLDISQELFCAVIYNKNAGPQSAYGVFVRACAIDTHGHFTRAMLYGNLQGKCRTPIKSPCFVRACEIENNIDMSSMVTVRFGSVRFQFSVHTVRFGS